MRRNSQMSVAVAYVSLSFRLVFSLSGGLNPVISNLSFSSSVNPSISGASRGSGREDDEEEEEEEDEDCDCPIVLNSVVWLKNDMMFCLSELRFVVVMKTVWRSVNGKRGKKKSETQIREQTTIDG